jgi:hypothetical protein
MYGIIIISILSNDVIKLKKQIVIHGLLIFIMDPVHFMDDTHLLLVGHEDKASYNSWSIFLATWISIGLRRIRRAPFVS